MKPNIVIAINSGEQLGGVERHVGDIVKGLSNEFSFTIVCKDGPMVKEYLANGASFVELYPRFDFDPFYQLRLLKLLRSLNPTAIHAHELKAGFNAMLAGFIANVPVRIYHVHTPIREWQLAIWKKLTFGRLNLLVNWFTGNFLATKVIALTNVIKKERMELEGIKESKIIIIPNGVDAVPATVDKKTLGKNVRKEWGVEEKEFVIGNIGRLTVEKGHEVLIKAFATLLLEKPDCYLVLAGDGILRNYLENLCKKIGVFSRVEFLGSFESSQKYKILAGFDIFVSPSLAEGFGISLIEAMGAKIPVLASNLPVFRDVGKDTIEYFKRGDSEDLAEKIVNFKHNEEKIKEAYNLVIKTYSMEKFLDSYKKLYLSLL